VDEAPPLRALRGETVRNEAESILTPGSGSLRRRRVSSTPVRDAAGKVLGSVSVVRDVTDEVALQERLQVTARLAALGTLVAGVAHEINNPLAAEVGNVEFARRSVDDLRARLRSGTPVPPVDAAEVLDGVVEALGDSMESVRRMGAIVRDLVAFGRDDALRQRVGLREVVEMGLRWFAASSHVRRAVEVEDSGAPAVLAVPGHLAQVVLNLVTNAWQARTGDRTPHVVVRLGTGPPGWARLEVADDGAGMPPEVLARAFDPFFTTREVGQGAGLGLSICHSIVTAHGGQIAATSRPGEGTTVRIDLPAADAAEGTAAATAGVTLRA
jgi:signal transduction histidine kinase